MGRDRLALRLYQTHREALVSYARKLSGDPAAAEDIVQDAWLQFDRQPHAEDIREPLGYLKRIVRNLVFARARRARHERQATGPDAAEAVTRLVDERPSIEAELMAQEEMRLVMQVVQSLPLRQQAAFRMYHFEELKLREVAERLGISVSLAHLLVTEAMQRCDERRRREAR